MKTFVLVTVAVLALLVGTAAQGVKDRTGIGRELAVPRHLSNGEELTRPRLEVIALGKQLFSANWTDQDGGGRPLSKGTGAPLSNRAARLEGARGFNRVSGPDANSCLGCHNRPNGMAGGAGDFVSNVFQLAQRFDFVTFGKADRRRGGGALDEAGRAVSLVTVGNARSAPGLFGAGYVEMLARQMTEDLQRVRASIGPGQAKLLVSKGVQFGTLRRRAEGGWDTRGVEGLPPQSLLVSGPDGAPSLVVRPWQQSASAVSLREMANTAFNQHHGMQSTERFGLGTDADGDGVVNELTRADITAVALFLATLPVPGRLIPSIPEVQRAVQTGERLFAEIQCTRCHVAALPLSRRAWIYSEPNPYNPRGNLRRGGARVLEVDLADASWPQPRLTPSPGDPSIVLVPAYTDFKLHDITDPTDETAKEPLDVNQPIGSSRSFAGNRKFLTRRLWGVASQPTHFHHGLFTTLRQAVMAHAGEALPERQAFERASRAEQDALIEFLKSLQMLPPN